VGPPYPCLGPLFCQFRLWFSKFVLQNGCTCKQAHLCVTPFFATTGIVVMRLSNFSAVTPFFWAWDTQLSNPLCTHLSHLPLSWLGSCGLKASRFRVCCNIIIIIDLLILSSGFSGSRSLLLLQGPVAILMTPPIRQFLYMYVFRWGLVSVLRLAVRWLGTQLPTFAGRWFVVMSVTSYHLRLLGCTRKNAFLQISRTNSTSFQTNFKVLINLYNIFCRCSY